MTDRERKFNKKASAALSDTELLQALIGSGNRQASVARIAKRTAKLFKQFGGDVEYEQLQRVSGLGPARVALIMAALEFARRYLMPPNKPVIRTDSELLSLIEPFRHKSQPTLVYVLLDGARRLIMKRTIRLDNTTISITKIFREAVREQAVHILIVFIRPDGVAIPTLHDLTIMRSIKQSASALSITIKNAIVATRHEYVSILTDP